MNRYGTDRLSHRFHHRLGIAISEVIVLMIVVAALAAVALPVLAANNGGMGIAGSKRNLTQLHMAHQMYAADYNGNQWVNVAHDLATFGDTYSNALNNWINSLGGSSHPYVDFNTGQWMTFLGWGVDSESGFVGMWRYPWNVYTMPIHLDNSQGPYKGFGYYRMMHTRGFNPYVNGKMFDRSFFAPRHAVALSAVGDCFEDQYEFCLGEGNVGHAYWPSYSLSPAALFHPDMWNVPEDQFPANMDAVFAEFDNAFHALPYASAKYPDLKTHIAEHAWLQNNTAGPCNDQYSPVFGSYDGCLSWKFNASLHSAPVTLFYDGHVRLLPLTEVQAADDQIGVWRRDTPMGPWGYFGELAWDNPAPDGPANPSHHILTNGGILGRDTLGQ